jgi:S-formylglutathione hydrolase FrmB
VISAPVMTAEAMLEFTDNRLYKIFIPTHRIWGRPSIDEVRKEDPFAQWRDEEDIGLRLYLAWAEGDRGMIVMGNERLKEHLEARGIPHGGGEFPGEHDWVSWGPVIRDALAYNVGGDTD